MKILTGGLGFIGGHILELDKDLTIIDDLSHSFDVPFKVFIKYRLGSFSYNPKNVEIIYHLAANISVKESMEKPAKVLDNNVRGVLEVAEWARKNDAKIVFASSAAVYGDKDGVLKEDMELEPISVYGLSKKIGEEILRKYHELYGLDIVILRYANVYGPRQDPGVGAVIPTFIVRMLQGKEVYFYGDGSQVRDFVFVKDVARITLESSRLKGFHVFNLGTGIGTSIKELFEIIDREIGYGKKPLLKPEREGDIKKSVFDVSRLKRFFDIDFVPIEEGLRKTIKYYRF